jgi:hypothetical protein
MQFLKKRLVFYGQSRIILQYQIILLHSWATVVEAHGTTRFRHHFKAFGTYLGSSPKSDIGPTTKMEVHATVSQQVCVPKLQMALLRY